MDLDFTLTKNPITNDILVLNSTQAIKNSVKNIIITRKGERLFQPFLGTNISALLFGIADKTLADSMIAEIKNVINLFEPRISITNITVYLDDIDDHSLYVDMTYVILDTNVADGFTQILQRDR
jgi:uncharacterized protein